MSTKGKTGGTKRGHRKSKPMKHFRLYKYCAASFLLLVRRRFRAVFLPASTTHHPIPSKATRTSFCLFWLCRRLFLEADKTIVSVVDRNGISDTYETIATGKYSEIPLVSDGRTCIVLRLVQYVQLRRV